MIAAIYAALTLIFAPLSFGPVQMRPAEALTLLPILTADAIPGLFIGCFLVNLITGSIWFDVVFGSIATLLAAILSYKLRKNRYAAAAMPAAFNGPIVGAVVYFAYVRAPGAQINKLVLMSTVFSVAAGELVICYTLGLLLVKVVEKRNLL